MQFLLCPRWLLNRLPIGEQIRLHVNVFLSVLLVCLSAPVLVRVPHFCLFRHFLGVPCPGCGVTHSLIALEQMQFREAWCSNPAGVPLAMYLAFQFCARPFALCAERVGAVVSGFSKVGEQFVLSALLVVWLMRVLHF
jgi:Protein of unknown function (DUF2752)